MQQPSSDEGFDDFLDYSHISIRQLERMRALAVQRANLRIDPLRLYEPLQGQQEIHASNSPQRILRGGNRSGKTVSCAIEIARAALRCDPFNKYPTARPLLIYLIGFDQDHTGRVFHRVLFRPGLFKIIRDLKTNMWRAFRPLEDAAREDEAKPAPPLIPPRQIEEIAWINRRERVFSLVRLKNGTEIRAFSSKSDPAQGDKVNLIWVDEDLYDERWITEMQSRLSDEKGRLLWSAFPHSRNDALVTLSQRARDPENLARAIPDVFERVLVFSENPFIDSDQKRMRRADFASMSEEELNARDRGEFITESVMMYPSFNINLHGAPHAIDDPMPDTLFDRGLRDNGNQPPADWTRYAAIDPGHSVCCALFFAVPPPDVFGEYVLLYDEMYVRQCTAAEFGRQFSLKCSGQSFQAFVIDEHGSRVTDQGYGKTIKQQYSDQLRMNRVESNATGHGFISGSDDRHARSMIARGWMGIRDDGTTKFRILKGRCPNFVREIPFYRKQVQDRTILDVPNTKTARLCHAMAAFEYMAAYNPQWVRKPKKKEALSPAYALFLADEKKNRSATGDGIWLGAGSGR